MKRCPECRRDYSDETLLYCLDDGTALLDGPASPDERATAILSEPGAVATGFRASESPTREQVHTTDQTAIFPPGTEAEPRNSVGDSSERQSLSAHRVAEPEGSADRGWDKRLLAAPVVLAIIVVCGFFGYRYFASNSKQIESIAVMPFVDDSGNPEGEYLSDGMTEALISSLSRLPNLKVKARNSVFRYKGKEISPQTLSGELSVQAVLLGRVAHHGDELTLHLELIDAPTETVIWSEQYKRKQVDLLGLQSDIARDVSNKLKTKLAGTDQQRLEKRPTENTVAYQLYLRGRWEWNKRQKDSLVRAAEYFKQAIEMDPGFALAHAGLADCYIVFNAYEVAPPGEAYALARAAVQKALELDGTLGEAYATLASINDDYDWDFAGAERNYLRAIELSPNYATAHQWYAEHLRMVGRFDEAVAQSNRAIELDPVSLSVNRGLGETLHLAGRCDEAIPQFHKTIELDPGFHGAYGDLAECYALKGRYDEAITQHRKAVERSGGNNSQMASLACTLAKAGKAAEARKILQQLEERRKSQFVDGAFLAPVYYALGDLDTAFAQLDRSCKDRSPAVRYIKVDPRYGNNFRSDRRYAEVVRKIGLP